MTRQWSWYKKRCKFGQNRINVLDARFVHGHTDNLKLTFPVFFFKIYTSKKSSKPVFVLPSMLSLYHGAYEKVKQELCDWSKSRSSEFRCEQTRVRRRGYSLQWRRWVMVCATKLAAAPPPHTTHKRKYCWASITPPWRNDFLAGIPIITPCRPVHIYRLLVEGPPNRRVNRTS